MLKNLELASNPTIKLDGKAGQKSICLTLKFESSNDGGYPVHFKQGRQEDSVN